MDVSQKEGNKPATRREPTARQFRFAQLVASGKSQAEAYRQVYSPHCTNRRAAEKGCNLAAHPTISREIERLRAKSEAKTLLTINDRLGILSSIAQKTDAKDGDKISAVMGYSKLAGDQSPDRMVLTGADGAPLQAVVTVNQPLVRRVSPRERLESMRKSRALRGAPLLPESAAPKLVPPQVAAAV